MSRKGEYVREKISNKIRIYEEVDPKPSPMNVLVLNRYYSVLKPVKGYRRRVSWIECTAGEKYVALVEYQWPYPFITSSHSNSTKHQDDDYIRTNLKTLQKISKMSKCQTPRDVYKSLTIEDSFNGPRLKTNPKTKPKTNGKR